MARFTIPREVYFGKGTVAELKNLKGSKAAIVISGGSVKRNGGLEKVEGFLGEAGMETILIEGVEADPSVATVMKGVEVLNEFQPDWIVGVGGGSPIDAAKAMWIFYENPGFTFEEAARPSTCRNCAKRPALRRSQRPAAPAPR